MSEQIKTRFAPSPTGFLHVGGARTALFNYLYVQRYGGQFRLRIEDTDKKRSNREMIQMILKGLEWLDIRWDDEIIFQGANFRRHLEIASVLLEKNKAYPCFCSKEELEIHRKDFRYDGHCRQLTAEELTAKKALGISYSIRFKVPEGETSWDDEIHGNISFKNDEIEDFIIVRSDNSPTYNLAVVADDFDMGINLVIRGDDHISNTPKQILLYQAADWKIPRFAHVPLILGSDGKRLSKRHGATSVSEYKQKGVLSKALFNFLAILGWSPPDGKELLSFQEIVNNFSLSSVSKKSAVFDENKLAWMNQQYLLQASAAELFNDVSSRWLQKKFINSEHIEKNRKRLLNIIDLLKPRAIYVADFVDLAEYFFIQPQNFNRKGLSKYLSDEQNWAFLAEITAKLMAANDFRSDHLEKIFRQYAEEINISAGIVIHPVRLALTGRTASPGLFEVMELLGRQEVIRRLNYFLKKKEFFQKELTE